jgi:hypothetical protein
LSWLENELDKLFTMNSKACIDIFLQDISRIQHVLTQNKECRNNKQKNKTKQNPPRSKRIFLFWVRCCMFSRVVSIYGLIVYNS